MSNVKTFSKKTNGNMYLSTNFKVSEFACKDGTDKVLIDNEMVFILQKIREIAGKAVVINSAYRTVSHNKKQGGASNSYHLYGRAFDIKSSGLTVDEICAIANTLGVKGIIKYSNFVHIDSRVSRYHYNNISKLKTNFAEYKIVFNGTNIKSGSKGTNVGIVQFKLNSLGYNCGVVDGICGNKTINAIKTYQRNNNLAVDGICGRNTWGMLFN